MIERMQSLIRYAYWTLRRDDDFPPRTPVLPYVSWTIALIVLTFLLDMGRSARNESASAAAARYLGIAEERFAGFITRIADDLEIFEQRHASLHTGMCAH